MKWINCNYHIPSIGQRVIIRYQHSYNNQVFFIYDINDKEAQDLFIKKKNSWEWKPYIQKRKNKIK